MPAPRAAYLHVPFCRHRCGYCNFTLVAGRDDLIASYLQALELELSQLVDPRPVQTLFIGGGTPTHLSDDQLHRLLTIACHWFPLSEPSEFSVEANPLDVSPSKVSVLAAHGVTRLSLGVQSWDPHKLECLERDHRAAEIERACRWAEGSFHSLGLDLIFGVPGESREVWGADLERTIQLRPHHISTYGLTIERGTQFWNRLQKSLLQPLVEDDQRWMYETAIDELTAAGWEHYEVSNFARSGHRCRHNEVYWTGGEYYAAGPGAARYVDGRRELNHRSTTTYLKRVLAGQSPVAERDDLSPEDRAREQLVFGLRRMEGIQLDQFAERTGYRVGDLAEPALTRFQQLGFLQIDQGRLQLTRAGLLVSDSLWPDFLSP